MPCMPAGRLWTGVQKIGTMPFVQHDPSGLWGDCRASRRPRRWHVSCFLKQWCRAPRVARRSQQRVMLMIGRGNILAGSIALLAAGTLNAAANEKATFGTNWLAEPEHGGYYQAVADGTYAA